MSAITRNEDPVSAPGVNSHLQVTLQVGVFFDGTGNNRLNSISDGSAKSNVAHLYELYCNQVSERLAPAQTRVSLSVYVEGIGTYTGEKDSTLSSLTGRYGAGVLARAQQAATRVVEQIGRWGQINPQARIARIELDLFGFSRGAAAARHFANDIYKGSASQWVQAWSDQTTLRVDGFDWQSPTAVAINFIGLFDSVAGIISFLEGNFSAANANNSGVEMALSPAIARKIVHLVARDEYRKNFALTQAPADIVVPGAHADVGGGYLPLVREQLVLSRPVSSVEPRTLADEASQAYRETQAFYHRHHAAWQQLNLEVEFFTQATDLPGAQPCDSVPQKRVLSCLRAERNVQGELAWVYLHIMHKLATEQGVPFVALEAPCAALPQSLHTIAAKLMAYACGEQASAGLSAEEEALLRQRFIHVSSDWSVAGAPRAGRDAMFINRPHESGQRDVFPNEPPGAECAPAGLHH